MENIYIKTKDLSQWLKEKYFNEKDFYSIDELIEKIEDLDCALEDIEERFQNYKEYVRSNFKEMSEYERIGYNENW